MKTFGMVQNMESIVRGMVSKCRRACGLTSIRLKLALLLCVGGSVDVWGNTASSANSSSDIKDGKIVFTGNHATFTFAASSTTITNDNISGAYSLGKISHGASKACTFSWTANTGCSIKVTKIEFGVRGYTANVTKTGEMKATFNGTTEEIGSIGLSYTNFSATNDNGFANNVGLTLKNTCSGHGLITKSYDEFQYYIGNIKITYIITPDAPTIKATTATVNVSLTNENKLDMTSLIGVSDVTDFMPVSFASNSFNDPQGISTSGAYTFTGRYFYATKAGVYTFTNPYIAVKSNCHAKSGTTSGTVTITVDRLNPTMSVDNSKAVNVSRDKNNLTVLDLSECISYDGNGSITYSLISGPTSSTGEIANNNCSIDGASFAAWVAGTYTIRASSAMTAQYNANYKDFTVTVNHLTQTISWSTDESVFVEDDVISASSLGDVTLEKSGAGAEFVSIEGNTATIGEVETNSSVTLTATAAQTDVYAEATDSKTISLTSLAKQHITFDQNLTKLKTTDGTKKVQLVATSDSGRDSYITFEVDANTAGVTVTQENGTWYLNYSDVACKNIMVTAHLDGVVGVSVAAADVSQMVKVTDPTAKCDIEEVLVNKQTQLKNAFVTYDIDIPASMTVSFSRMKTGFWDVYVQGLDVEFYSGRNASGAKLYTMTYSASNINNTLKNSTIDLSNFIQAKSVKITTSSTNGYYIDDISYKHQSYATPSVNALNFEAFALSTVGDQQLTIDYANYQIELSIEGSTNFKLKSADAFGDCGDYGKQTVTIGYDVPAEAMEETAYLRIKDNTGTLLNTVTLHANVLGGLVQNITSHNIATSYLTTDQVELTATTDRGLTNFSFEVSPTDVAQCDGNILTFNHSGTVSITIKEAGNGAYAEASQIVNDIIIRHATPTIATIPSTSSIHYLDNLSASAFDGGSATVTLRGVENTPVEGTFAWTSPAVINDAQGVHNYTATFTPTNTGMYNSTTVDVPVTILRNTAPAVAVANTTTLVSDMANDRQSLVNLNDLITLPAQQPMVKNNFTFAVKSVDKEGFAYSSATTETGIVDNANNTFYATQAGVYTITATTPETDYYESIDIDFTITVNKRPNVISVKGNNAYSEDIYTDSETTGLVIASTNPDEANRPISCIQTAGEDIVSFNRGTATATSNYRLGTATWRLYQAEDALYAAAEAEFTINVVTMAQTTCDWEDALYYNPNEYSIQTDIDALTGTIGGDVLTVANGQYAKDLYISIKGEAIEVALIPWYNSTFALQYSTDGNTFFTLAENLDVEKDVYKTFGPFAIPEGQNITHLRAYAERGAMGRKYFKDIRITRKAALSADDLTITKTASNLPVYINQQGIGTLAVDWSIVGGGDLTLISTNPKFTLSQTTIEGAECNNGRTNVTVSYQSATAGTDNGKIIIYNKTNRIEVNVTGTTLKNPQTILWYDNGELLTTNGVANVPVHVGDQINAITSQNHEVAFTSTSDASVININALGQLELLKEGTVTIHAHGGVTDDDRNLYAEVDEDITFIVTKDIIQSIVWNQTLMGLVEGDDDVELSAYATWTDEGGTVHQRTVTYTVAEPTIAEVLSGNTLHILTHGTTTITATAAGGEEDELVFLEATATKKIIVRDPNAPCDTYIYTQESEVSRDCGYNLRHHLDATVEFDLSNLGQPRTCNFDYTGAAQIVNNFFSAGTVKLEQYIGLEDQWEVVAVLPAYGQGSKTNKGTYVNSGDIALDYRATKLHVSVYDAVGYFYVNNMQVTLAQYISTDVDHVDFGKQYVGTSTVTPDPVVISYSNIQGPISIVSDNPLFVIEESKRLIEGACGDVGTATFTITYKPTVESDNDAATITISDGRTTSTIAVTGSAVEIPTYTFDGNGGTSTIWGETANWTDPEGDHVKPANQDINVRIASDAVVSGTVTANNMAIAAGATVTVAANSVLNAGGSAVQGSSYGNLVIAQGGRLNMKETGDALQVNDFTLKASIGDNAKNKPASSGQVTNLDHLQVNGDMYFEIALDPSGACSYGWYDFSVPFEVDVNTGITRYRNSDHKEIKITNGVNFRIMVHDEASRADGGRGWKWESGTLVPGKCYTITIDDVDNVYRFKKKAGTSFKDNSTIAMDYTVTSKSNDNFGWNGVGNSTLTYANATALGVSYAQIYNHAEMKYEPIAMSATTFVVGSAFFIQAPAAENMTLNRTLSYGVLRAPSRENEVTAFTLELKKEGASYAADRLFVGASEEAVETYQIGRDVTKFGTPTEAASAQIWVNAYNLQLCAVESPLVNDNAVYELGIYAPATGTFTLAAVETVEDQQLFLTYDGTPIWDLSQSAYTLTLPKGTNTHYGLQLVQTERHISTDVEETNDEAAMQKFMYNGVLYINHNGTIYDASGKKVTMEQK